MTKTGISDVQRKEILEAALKVVSEKGYQDTTIADIAAELETDQGTIYRYFKDKQEIASAVIDEVITRITLVILDVPAKVINNLDEFRERLFQVCNGLIYTLAGDPKLASWVFYESLGLPPEISRKIDAIFNLFASYAENYLKNGVERGFLRNDINTWETALLIDSMLFEVVKQLGRTPAATDDTRQVWLDTLIGLMLDGLAAKP